MSISEKLTTIKNSLEDIKDSVVAKGQTPSGGITTYATAIDNISVVNNTTTSINPTTSAQTVTPSGNYTGFDEVTVSAVTSAIDNNISAGNIKNGVSILGVSGSVVELQGETRSETLTSSAGNTFTPTSGKNGIISITVTPNNESRTVTPTTSSQSLTVNSGYSGNGTVTVNPVTSAIDNNITAGNIKNGVSILGVTGNYTGTTPTLTTKSITTNGTYNASSDNADGYSSVTVNVSGGITPTGTLPITTNGTYDVTNYASASVNVSGGGGSSTKYGITVDSILGDVNAGGTLQYPNAGGAIVFNGVQNIAEKALYYRFYYNPSIQSVSFPNLTTVSSQNAVGYGFYGSSLTSVDLSALTTISGKQAFYRAFQENLSLTTVDLSALTTISGQNGAQYMFYDCANLVNVSISNLTSITGQGGATHMFAECPKLTSMTFTSLSTLTASAALSNLFKSCYSLTSVSFPALTSTSFGSYTNQFTSLLADVDGCTVHFPSNLQSVIGSWDEIQDGFGGTNTTILYDLPATT